MVLAFVDMGGYQVNGPFYAIQKMLQWASLNLSLTHGIDLRCWMQLEANGSA